MWRGMGPDSGAYSTASVAGSLDAHLKQYLVRATSGWVTVVREKAGAADGRGPNSYNEREEPGCEGRPTGIAFNYLVRSFDLRRRAKGSDGPSAIVDRTVRN